VIRSPCSDCEGRGFNFGRVKETVNIPKGVDSGVNLRVAKKGNCGDGGPNGDLLLQIQVKPHAYFKRDGANVLSDCFVTIT
jgi:molecular chaperone DnaJ